MIAGDDKAELKRLIQTEVERQLNSLLNGQTQNATPTTEDIANLFPGMPVIQSRPKVQPFGFASMAPDGTLSFTARVGSHAGSRYVIGHRDKNVPTDLAKGESGLYSVTEGQLAYLLRAFTDGVRAGKGGTYETLVAGETLVELLTAIISALTKHTHSFTYVPGSNPPTEGVTDPGPDLSNLKSNYLDNDKVLLKDGGRF